MSASRAPAKQAKTMARNVVARTESVTDLEYAGENGRPTTSPQTVKKLPSHPKGHKVRQLGDIWSMLDKKDFVPTSDSLTLGDVWFQPVSVSPSNTAYANVLFEEIVFAPHLKWRKAETKIAVDDLLRVLHLCDSIRSDMQQETRKSYEDWLKEKISLCVKEYGLEDGGNLANVANYIIVCDGSFSFYPECLGGICGFFFRKIAYHSYKKGDVKDADKMSNPSMIKCCATRGTFDYMYEVRIIAFPAAWFHRKEDDGDAPASQMP